MSLDLLAVQDCYNEELQEQLHGQQQEITQRNWDDDFVLKRQFSGKVSLSCIH